MTEFVKYTLTKDNDVIGYTVFNSGNLNFRVGDQLQLQGWQRQENRHNILLAKLVNEENVIQ